MRELNGNRTFPDGRSRALDRTMSHITCHKNSGYAAFQQVRGPLFLPDRCELPGYLCVRTGQIRTYELWIHQIRTCENKAFIVAKNRIRQPFGSGDGSDKYKYR